MRTHMCWEEMAKTTDDDWSANLNRVITFSMEMVAMVGAQILPL